MGKFPKLLQTETQTVLLGRHPPAHLSSLLVRTPGRTPPGDQRGTGRGDVISTSVSLACAPAQGVFPAPAPQCPKPTLWKGREKRKEPPSPVSRWGWRPASISKACTGRLDVQEPSDGPGNSVRTAPWSKGLVVTPGIEKKSPKVQLVIPNC